MSANHLIHEKSLYLLQHAQNPVDWYPWGEEAFAKARAEDKPIFLSIGYSTCHWCHVMERESFSDDEVAVLLNERYVSVKVDREERPDIDAVYMQVCQAMTGSGGWPLTILMTADQKPFYAGTYLPKVPKFGKPGLVDLLTGVGDLWKERRDELLAAAEEVAAFSAQDRSRSSARLEKGLLRSAVQLFRQGFDPGNGGFSPAPKFPMPHNLLFLLRYSELERDAFARKMAETTLVQMARGGIFDQLGGGFSRYSTDAVWMVPHFEKMLYDNALLSFAYLEAFSVTGNVYFRTVAERTLSYVLRELHDGSGGFYAGQDADSEGVEGRFYVFSRAEVLDVLGEVDGAVFCDWFGISGMSVPNLLQQTDFTSPDPRIAGLCERMYAYRKARAELLTDDKMLTAWNALMLAACAKAFRVLGDERYLAAAQGCRRFVAEHLTDDAGRLLVRFRDGEAKGMGQLADYAFYSWALLELYAADFDPSCLVEACRLADLMRDLFYDEVRGGFFLYASDAERLIGRPKEVYDGAMPSGNSMAAQVLVRLARLTAEPERMRQAEEQLAFVAGNAGTYPAGYSLGLLAMAEMLYPAGEVVCCSAEDVVPPGFLDLLERSHATAVVKSPKTAAELSRAAPFTAAYPVPDTGSVLYFCRDGRCAELVGSVAELAELMRKW
ncbi:MAG: thioredoxin domain-containing protein [Methanocorpusculum sp.]|nr:thioredoxin domain-containing protein [Methanocorpusculum sp.]